MKRGGRQSKNVVKQSPTGPYANSFAGRTGAKKANGKHLSQAAQTNSPLAKSVDDSVARHTKKRAEDLDVFLKREQGQKTRRPTREDARKANGPTFLKHTEK